MPMAFVAAPYDRSRSVTMLPGWPWRFIARFQKLQRSRAISPLCGEHLEHLALVIHGAPEVAGLAIDPHEHLVQMPALALMTAVKEKNNGRGFGRDEAAGAGDRG